MHPNLWEGRFQKFRRRKGLIPCPEWKQQRLQNEAAMGLNPGSTSEGSMISETHFVWERTVISTAQSVVKRTLRYRHLVNIKIK